MWDKEKRKKVLFAQGKEAENNACGSMASVDYEDELLVELERVFFLETLEDEQQTARRSEIALSFSASPRSAIRLGR